MVFNSNAQTTDIYRFDKDSKASGWIVINDGVMGGLSKGNIEVNEEGNGVFWGRVSLENNGGFSLARLSFSPLNGGNYSKIVLIVKGDKKRYQFRVKSNKVQMHSHISFFETNGEWQRIEIPFTDLTAAFRGRELNLPPYSGEQLEEIGLLIGNKVAEDFEIQIKSITLE